ncbi:MAG: hypothetical protein IMW93_00305 [Thermoanaerobacteraceae bacterium]|nr:hypothetical protein [Thermoanaerobacteraceae bacterium]
MYHPGEIKTPGLELLLVLLRLFIFAGTLFLVAGIGIIVHSPAVVTGVVAGIAAFTLLVSGIFEVVNYRCPHCGYTTRTIKGFGSYRCPRCQQSSYITGM